MLSSPDTGTPIPAPNNRRRRLILSFGVILVLGAASTSLWSGKDRMVGAGSTLAQPVIHSVWTGYQQAGNADDPLRPAATGGDYVPANLPLDYEPVGSLGGIMRMDDPLVDFAISDYPLTPEGLAEKGLIQFPMVVGAVGVVHNLDLPAGQALRLDEPTLASIYAGEITRWNDPALAALNPGLPLPEAAINPVHRAEGSGSTYNFTAYLAAGDAGWQQAYGTGSEIAWPGGTAARGSDGMIEAIRAAPGSLGYVEAGQGARAGLGLAALANASGQFHPPSPEGIRAAVAGMAWDPEQHFHTPIAASSDPAAYPMTTPVYAMLRAEAARAGDRERARAFLRFFLHAPEERVKPLGFLPLPEQGTAAVESYWAEMAAPNPS